jgi:hypothetical protein
MNFLHSLSLFWMNSIINCYKEITHNYNINNEQRVNLLDHVFVLIYIMLDRHLRQEFDYNIGTGILNKTMILSSEAYLWEVNTRTDWKSPMSELEIQNITERHVVSQRDHSRLEAVLQVYSKWRNLRLYGERGLIRKFAENIANILSGKTVIDDNTEPDAATADIVDSLSSELEAFYNKRISLAEKDFPKEWLKIKT